MRQHRYPRAQQPQQQPVSPPQNTAAEDTLILSGMLQGGSGANPEYPTAYEQQEAQILEQIIARRRAYMQQYGRAEQKFIQQKPGASQRPVDPEKAILNDLFSNSGDV